MAQTVTVTCLLLDLPMFIVLDGPHMYSQAGYPAGLLQCPLTVISQTQLGKKSDLPWHEATNAPSAALYILHTCSQTSSGSCSSFALCYYWKRSPDLQETGRCSKGWFLGLCPQHFFTGDVQSMSHVYIFLPFISENKIKSFSFLLKHLRLEIESK